MPNSNFTPHALKSPTLQLPPFFADHMVCQRETTVQFFGEAAPGARVAASLAGEMASTLAGQDGRWTLEFPPFPAGGPHELVIQSRRMEHRIRDILFGDVWFCSGQSNMEFPLARTRRAEATLRAANLSQIRHFTVGRQASDLPSDAVTGCWEVCRAKTAGGFTAVGFHFAREVHRRTGIPIGLIHSSWGGSALEAWIPPEAYRNIPALQPLKRIEARLKNPDSFLKAAFRRWKKENVSLDPGNKGKDQGWARPDFDDSQWGTLRVPGFWEGQGLAIDGAVWFRQRVPIPAAWRGRRLSLELGAIDDFDQTYFNGELIGTTGPEVENAYRVERRYQVPGRLTHGATVIVAVRIFDQFGSGGFLGPKEAMRLSCPGCPGSAPASLAGRWRYQIEWSVERPSPVPQPPAMPEPRIQLSRLYNGMVHPFRRYPIKGFLWYQGESNASRAAHYGKAFPCLIRSWRDCWRAFKLPFYFVQLANFKVPPKQPGEDCWAELREAQAQALDLPATGMAVAIDVGEQADIHPRNKRAVGTRLAKLALAHNYGSKAAWAGPALESWKVVGHEIILKFREVGTGLRTLDGKALRGFAVAGRDYRWRWARARKQGACTIILHSPEVLRPVAVRYGWATNPNCNLANSQRLPAAPFRTDEQPLSTDGVLWPL